MSEGYSIGVDIGGTFTDLVLYDSVSQRLAKEKVLTTSQDPSQGVLSGIRMLLKQAGVAGAQVGNVIHGTTLVANALIERKGVEVALITTKGFRDVLEIGREIRYDTYDLNIMMPPQLVERDLRLEISERMSAQGEVIKPLDLAGIDALASVIRVRNVKAVAVCLLHAYRNPAHERAIRERLAQILPEVTVAISSEVMPSMGEYERASTTVCNAYVQPMLSSYIGTLSKGIADAGIRGELYLMLSDGGSMHRDGARRFPIRLVQSGPAGGVQAAALIGRLTDRPNVLCFDMGGTTAKACLIDDFRPMRTTDFEVARVWRFKKGSGLPLKVPVVDMIEIGAGGGSIAMLDRIGFTQVGPESAGSEPGPACYGFGGMRPTVTDADLVLGFIDAGSFLGGDMKLDRERASAAIAERIAQPGAMGVTQAAWSVFETVTEGMAQAAAVHALEKGRKLSEYAMVAIGGAGPVHAWSVARRVGIGIVICPAGAGIASAYGFLSAPMSFEAVRADVCLLAELDGERARSLVDGLADQASRLLQDAGVARADITILSNCSSRYAGQGYEVEFAVEPGRLRTDAAGSIRRAFERRYLELYGRLESVGEIEIVSWMVRAVGPNPGFRLGAVYAADAVTASTSPPRRRPIYFGTTFGEVDALVVDRATLQPGSHIAGPAAIEERESTIIIPPDASAVIDAIGNVVIDLRR